jgi:GNAT superfamily N-acetyltransferase
MNREDHRPPPIEERRNGLLLSSDPARVRPEELHAFLQRSYWARGIPIEVVRRSLAHSLPFGVYDGSRLVAFARVISDRATFAWVGDVFVDEAYRGRGLSKWLMEAIRGHAELQGLRRWLLATHDAHTLYAQFGFKPLERPQNFMEIARRDFYHTNDTTAETPPSV